MDLKFVLLLAFLAGVCSAEDLECEKDIADCIYNVEDPTARPKNMVDLCEIDTGVLYCLQKVLPTCKPAANIEAEVIEITGMFIKDTCNPESDLYKAFEKDFNCLMNISVVNCNMNETNYEIMKKVEDQKYFEAFCVGKEAVGKCIDNGLKDCADAEKEINKEYSKLSDFIATKHFDGKKCNGAGIQMTSYAVLSTAFLVATKSIWF